MVKYLVPMILFFLVTIFFVHLVISAFIKSSKKSFKELDMEVVVTAGLFAALFGYSTIVSATKLYGLMTLP